MDRIYALAQPSGDGYVAKLDATGSLVFSTLIGGRNSDKILGVAIAPDGGIILGGTTQSDDLPPQPEFPPEPAEDSSRVSW